jgi:hypothetical protein
MTANTPNFALTYPQSTDHDRLWEHFQELATDTDTALAAILATYLVPVEVNGLTVGTLGSGFTLGSAVCRTLMNGRQVDVKLDLVSTSAITSSSGDIPDTVCFTLATAYRPTEFRNFHFSAGAPNGDVQVGTDGTVTLRSANVTIAATSNVRMSFSYIKTA